MLVFFKDLLIITSTAIFQRGMEQLMFSGNISLAYTFIVAMVLSYAERSANNADVLTSLLLAMQMLLTAGFCITSMLECATLPAISAATSAAIQR